MDTTLDLSAVFEQETWDDGARDALKTLAFANTSSINRFRELLNELEQKTDAGEGKVSPNCLHIGFCHILLGDTYKAQEWLNKADDSSECSYLLGMVLRDLRKFDESTAEFEKAATQGWDRIECECQHAESALMSEHFDVAKNLLEKNADAGEGLAIWHYTRGRLFQESGELEQALAEYDKTLDCQADHPQATFHLAYLADLHGDDSLAFELYLSCVDKPFVHFNVLINLAILHEDRNQFKKAEACLRRVLTVSPNHPRALLYLKDVVSAQSMVIDEQQLADQEKRDAVLDIPVTDFELSVRSRNCLKKMNMNTLGDLLRTTEAELLAYKNFGETSLREIKVMLTQKGLSLGQDIPEGSGPSTALGEAAPDVSQEMFDKPVAAMELSIRSRKCLQRLGIATVGELISRTESELLGSRNFGQTSLAEIKECLTNLNLSLRKVGEQ